MSKRLMTCLCAAIVVATAVTSKVRAQTEPPDMCDGQHGTFCFTGGCPGDGLGWCTFMLGCNANNALCGWTPSCDYLITCW